MGDAARTMLNIAEAEVGSGIQHTVHIFYDKCNKKTISKDLTGNVKVTIFQCTNCGYCCSDRGNKDCPYCFALNWRILAVPHAYVDLCEGRRMKLPHGDIKQEGFTQTIKK